MRISKELSATFMIANLIAIILIILIHYNSKWAIDISNGYTLNYYIQEVLVNGIARSAVPIFAFLSGYFLIEKLLNKGYKATLINKFYTLLRPYIVASIILYLPFFIYGFIFHTQSFNGMGLYSYIYIILLHPLSGQFWFLRDLMVLVLISPILFYSKKSISYILLVVLFFIWILDIQPFPKVADWYILNNETLFFFFLGGIMRKYSFNFESILFSKKIIKIIVALVWFTLILLRVYIDPWLDVWYTNNYTLESIILYKIAIFVGILSIFQISTIFSKNNFFLYLSGLTFFVFLFHNSPLHRITHVTDTIIDSAYSFYVYFLFIVFLMFITSYFTSKYIPFFYNMISGNRNPDKSLTRLDSIGGNK